MGEALKSAGIAKDELAAIGITNQRETAVVWDKTTGEAVYNAIVWQDTRTDQICNKLMADGGQDRFRPKTGLPIATYFSGPKVRWILENVEGAAARAESGDLLFGNMDTWVIWNLTGGTDGGLHITDVTNASRTMLMDLATSDWDDELLKAIGVPRAMLPEIKGSSEVYGEATLPAVAGGPGGRRPRRPAGRALRPDLLRGGRGQEHLRHRELPAAQHGHRRRALEERPHHDGRLPDRRTRTTVYALEGSIAITGALVQWLRDNLKMIKAAPEVEELAMTVEDNGGVYFVPAFSGLFAPYWRSDARGVIAGLTRYVTAGHIARAVLEATAYQSREVVEAMNADSGVDLESLKVDGGMVANDLLMQFQSDILDVDVIRPAVAETTALGAAYAAGLAVGMWAEVEDLRENWVEDKRWKPSMDAAQRETEYRFWKKAVTKSFDWVEDEGGG